MNKTATRRCLFWSICLCLLAGSVPSFAQGPCFYEDGVRCETAGGRLQLLIRNRGQLRFTLKNPETGGAKGSFDIARYKLIFEGRFAQNWEFLVQTDLANGSESGSELLEDFALVYSKKPLAQLWIGQGKVAFGRQELTLSDKLQFVDRSLASERFAYGRDVGVALFGHNKRNTYSYSIGVYNGNGINKDEGDNIDNLIALRLVFTPFGRFDLDETTWRAEPLPESEPRSRLAIGVSAIRNTVGTEDFEEERITRGGFELAFQRGGFSMTAEFFTESADITLGVPLEEFDTDGWYAQVGYLVGRSYEFAGRYSEILRDVDSCPMMMPPCDSEEAGLAFNYYFAGHKRKLQADYRQVSFDAVGDQAFIDTEELRVQAQFIF